MKTIFAERLAILCLAGLFSGALHAKSIRYFRTEDWLVERDQFARALGETFALATAAGEPARAHLRPTFESLVQINRAVWGYDAPVTTQIFDFVIRGGMEAALAAESGATEARARTILLTVYMIINEANYERGKLFFEVLQPYVESQHRLYRRIAVPLGAMLALVEVGLLGGGLTNDAAIAAAPTGLFTLLAVHSLVADLPVDENGVLPALRTCEPLLSQFQLRAGVSTAPRIDQAEAR